MPWHKVVEEMRKRACREIGPDIKNLGIVWGLYVQVKSNMDDGYKRQNFTCTFENPSGEKRTYGYSAASDEVYW